MRLLAAAEQRAPQSKLTGSPIQLCFPPRRLRFSSAQTRHRTNPTDYISTLILHQHPRHPCEHVSTYRARQPCQEDETVEHQFYAARMLRVTARRKSLKCGPPCRAIRENTLGLNLCKQQQNMKRHFLKVTARWYAIKCHYSRKVTVWPIVLGHARTPTCTSRSRQLSERERTNWHLRVDHSLYDTPQNDNSTRRDSQMQKTAITAGTDIHSDPGPHYAFLWRGDSP